MNLFSFTQNWNLWDWWDLQHCNILENYQKIVTVFAASRAAARPLEAVFDPLDGRGDWGDDYDGAEQAMGTQITAIGLFFLGAHYESYQSQDSWKVNG